MRFTALELDAGIVSEHPAEVTSPGADPTQQFLGPSRSGISRASF